MNQATAIGRLSILAVGLGIGAAVVATPGPLGRPSTDASWIDQLLGGLSRRQIRPGFDFQISIYGI